MDASQSHSSTESFLVGFGETGLGSVLVATSAKGVVAILMGDDPGNRFTAIQYRCAYSGPGLKGGRPRRAC